jgi:uncharacterized CHY-type Zn-finger protein
MYKAKGITHIEIQCVACRKAMTEAQRTGNGGVCPMCRHRGVNAATTCEVVFVVGYPRSWARRLLERVL